MNKTTVRVLQEIIRNKNFSVEDVSRGLKKAKTTIYDCLAELRKENILDKSNEIKANELADNYKKLFLSYPYDFSFLTKNNLRILSLLEKKNSFRNIVKKSGLSRFTVNQLLKNLKNRGFLNKENILIYPPELLALLKIIRKYRNNYPVELPPQAVIVDRNEERDLIQSTKETKLTLHLTAFSAFREIITPYNYYTTKKKVVIQDIFDDAKILSRTKRDKLITALFYYKNRKKLKKDLDYEKLIYSEEFKRFREENERIFEFEEKYNKKLAIPNSLRKAYEQFEQERMKRLLHQQVQSMSKEGKGKEEIINHFQLTEKEWEECS